jgi:site-specific recombinase XerD
MATEGKEGTSLRRVVDTERAAELVPVDLVEAARHFAAASKAPRTRKAYRAAWGAFVTWCEAQGLQALPAAPRTVAAFLAARAREGRRVSTLEQSLAAISQAHQAAGLPSPRSAAEVREVLRGIRRTLGVAPLQKNPILVEDLRRMVATLPEDLLGVRDRAMLLVGFAGAFRRSELVGLDLADVVFTVEGLEVTLRRSKTDQEGQGRKLGIPYGSTAGVCPVRCLKRWLEAAGIVDGPLFRAVNGSTVRTERLSDKAVARLVKRAAANAGLDPSRFSGHSLPGRFRDLGSPGWQVRAVDHAADRSPLGADGPHLHPGSRALRRQPG